MWKQASLNSFIEEKNATSSRHSTSGSTYTYYISVELEKDCIFFIFMTSNFSTDKSITYKIRHTKNFTKSLITAIVLFIAALVFICAFLFRRGMRRRQLSA